MTTEDRTSRTAARLAAVVAVGMAAVALLGPRAGAAADTTPPITRITTADLSVLVQHADSGAVVVGEAADAQSGVAAVYVSFTPVAGHDAARTAMLDCAGGTCFWAARGPLLPGVWTVRAQAVDRAGNAESQGPSITVVIV